MSKLEAVEVALMKLKQPVPPGAIVKSIAPPEPVEVATCKSIPVPAAKTMFTPEVVVELRKQVFCLSPTLGNQAGAEDDAKNVRVFADAAPVGETTTVSTS